MCERTGHTNVDCAVIERVVGRYFFLIEVSGSGNLLFALADGGLLERVSPAHYGVLSGPEFEVGSLIGVQVLFVIFILTHEPIVVGCVDKQGHLVYLFGENIGRTITDIAEKERHFPLTIIQIFFDTAAQ